MVQQAPYQYRKQISELIIKLNIEMAHVLQSIGGTNQEILSCALIEPLRDKHMNVLTSLGVPFDFTLVCRREFCWADKVNYKEAKSLAGLCATMMQPILVPDLNDTSNPHVKFWVNLNSYKEQPDGGILSVPVTRWVHVKGKFIEECLAVLSVTSLVPGYFQEYHSEILDSAAGKISGILCEYEENDFHPGERPYLYLPAKIIPFKNPSVYVYNTNNNKFVIEKISHLKERESPPPTRKEPDEVLEATANSQLLVRLLDNVTAIPEDEFEKAMASLSEKINPEYSGKPGRKPGKFNRIWGAFRGRLKEGVTLDELASNFSASTQNRKAAATAVSEINAALHTHNIPYEFKSETIYYFTRRE